MTVSATLPHSPPGAARPSAKAIAPVPTRRTFPPRTVSSRSALSRRERVVYWALTLLWVVVVARFWMWWLRPEHQGALGLYLAASVPLAYLTTVLPSFYWFFVGRMRRPEHMEPAPDRRVAMITLCVPSHETLDVIAAQLEALTRVRYPHDSWVLDEGGDPDVEALAAELGVRYFTRKGRSAWNQPGAPFQAKTKAGNVNAWLDHVGMLGIDYDVFVQMDIDHHPIPEYLDRTLGYFDDPAVAWVQAPSVCGNLDRWTARGLAEQDLVLQGPLQMGFYGHSRTPFIIGSHTTYRTEAVRGIGGFQPTRAEDHLDTVALAAAGHTGRLRPGDHRDRRGPRGLRDLPRPAVRVGVLDGPDPPASHAAARAAVHARPGVPVPDGPELVHAVVVVARRAVGAADGGAAQRPARSPTSRCSSTWSTTSPSS